eukprot:333208_1
MHDTYKMIKYTTMCTDLQCNNTCILTEINIEYICGFLMNEDINEFKMVCKAIALICLREMRKIKINSFNLNTIQNLQKFKDLTSFKLITFDETVNFHRCHPIMIFDELLKIWSN